MELRAAALQATCPTRRPRPRPRALQARRAGARTAGRRRCRPSPPAAARPPAAAAAGAAGQVPRRSPFTPEGRAALLHAVAHIEFNAINLALDAVWRFAGLPEAFYRDWLRVAAEEALHFTCCASTWPRWATTTATSTPTTACGR
jgi:uncharacterized ferritin-like protein (DUF455 family)